MRALYQTKCPPLPPSPTTRHKQGRGERKAEGSRTQFFLPPPRSNNVLQMAAEFFHPPLGDSPALQKAVIGGGGRGIRNLGSCRRSQRGEGTTAQEWKAARKPLAWPSTAPSLCPSLQSAPALASLVSRERTRQRQQQQQNGQQRRTAPPVLRPWCSATECPGRDRNPFLAREFLRYSGPLCRKDQPQGLRILRMQGPFRFPLEDRETHRDGQRHGGRRAPSAFWCLPPRMHTRHGVAEGQWNASLPWWLLTRFSTGRDKFQRPKRDNGSASLTTFSFYFSFNLSWHTPEYLYHVDCAGLENG